MRVPDPEYLAAWLKARGGYFSRRHEPYGEAFLRVTLPYGDGTGRHVEARVEQNAFSMSPFAARQIEDEALRECLRRLWVEEHEDDPEPDYGEEGYALD